MTSSKSTRRALVSSALAILMCVVMLVGTTFAWFTDTASTGINKIQAGNLKMEVSYKNATTEGWFTTVNEETKVFDDRALWEPGHVEYVVLKVKNVGTLALKYKLGINIASETGSTNVLGSEFKLSDYIKFAVIDGEANLTNRADLVAAAEAADSKLIKEGYTSIETALKAASDTAETELPTEKTVTLVVWMPESVDNNANHATDVAAPVIKLGINVVATQYNHEYDSKGNNYDQNATYPVMNNAALNDALERISSGETLSIASGMYNLPATVIPDGVRISGAGADKTNLTMPATPYGSGKYTGLKINNPGVTISNATVSGDSAITSSDSYCGFIDINADGTVIDNVVINNNTAYSSSIVINRGVSAGSAVQISNVVLNGGFKPIHIVDGANGTVNIDNTEITATYTLNVNSASSQDLILNVTNSKLHGWTSYSPIKKASFINTEFSKGGSAYDFARPYADTLFENCTFDADFKLGGGAAGKTYELNNCTYAGAKLTAENIKNMLVMTGSDEPIKQCTIIVDGMIMQWS